eukprot:COSAG06_NODE_2687_length_6448_cov_4.882659_5_plen_118_part_00
MQCCVIQACPATVGTTCDTSVKSQLIVLSGGAVDFFSGCSAMLTAGSSPTIVSPCNRPVKVVPTIDSWMKSSPIPSSPLAQRDAITAQVPVPKKNVLFFELFLCLSRACLGKKTVFI